jgi:hypothetical protein
MPRYPDIDPANVSVTERIRLKARGLNLPAELAPGTKLRLTKGEFIPVPPPQLKAPLVEAPTRRGRLRLLRPELVRVDSLFTSERTGFWHAECDCGSRVLVSYWAKSLSCGCLKTQRQAVSACRAISNRLRYREFHLRIKSQPWVAHLHAQHFDLTAQTHYGVVVHPTWEEPWTGLINWLLDVGVPERLTYVPRRPDPVFPWGPSNFEWKDPTQ